jgi:hypothetical protein
MPCPKVLSQHSYGKSKERHENLYWESPSNQPKLNVGVGVGVRLAADSQSTSKSGYRASFWDP